MTSPRTFSHLGISVRDLERAIEFYRDASGLATLMGPTVTEEEADADTPVARTLTEVHGPGRVRLRVARLVLGDGIGLELQEFTGAGRRDGPADQRTAGVSHVCVQDPDVDGLVARIVEHGGKQRSTVMEVFPGRKPFRLAYCEDAFGNLIEVDSHRFETTYSPLSYPE